MRHFTQISPNLQTLFSPLEFKMNVVKLDQSLAVQSSLMTEGVKRLLRSAILTF